MSLCPGDAQSTADATEDSSALRPAGHFSPEDGIDRTLRTAEHSRFCNCDSHIGQCTLYYALKDIDSFCTFGEFFQQLSTFRRIILRSVASLHRSRASEEALQIADLYCIWSFIHDLDIDETLSLYQISADNCAGVSSCDEQSPQMNGKRQQPY